MRVFLAMIGWLALHLAAVPVAAQVDEPAARRLIGDQFGPLLPPEKVIAQGENFAKLESQFRKYAPIRMATEGSNWEWANFYDRAKIFFVQYARTGDKRYLAWGTDIALDYRAKYLEKNYFKPAAHWSMMTGIYIHFLIYNDPESRNAILRVAEFFRTGNFLRFMDALDSEMDNRSQARTIQAMLYAYRVEKLDPSAKAQGNAEKWSALLRSALGKILKTQSPDGAYRFTHTAQCGYNKPFMVALLNDALIEYYDLFEKDPRIPKMIGSAVRYLWNNNWDRLSQSFVYLEGTCGADKPDPTGDLNNLFLPGFGFMYRQTGDETYLSWGDSVLAGGIKGAWLDGSKQFNQSYYSAYRYPAYRAGATK